MERDYQCLHTSLLLQGLGHPQRNVQDMEGAYAQNNTRKLFTIVNRLSKKNQSTTPEPKDRWKWETPRICKRNGGDVVKVSEQQVQIDKRGERQASDWHPQAPLAKCEPHTQRIWCSDQQNAESQGGGTWRHSLRGDKVLSGGEGYSIPNSLQNLGRRATANWICKSKIQNDIQERICKRPGQLCIGS